MQWKLVLMTGNVKAHYIPENLHKDILEDICARHKSQPFETYDKDEAVHDVGGAAMIDEEFLTWELSPGMKFSTRVSHFEYALTALKKAELREIKGHKYYKIYGWLHCIVLLPEHRDLLLKAWEENLQKYSEKALCANFEFEKRMAEINKDGMKIQHVPRIKIPKDLN